MAPKIIRIAEVAIVVSDLERSKRFYRDVLGLKEFHHSSITPDRGVTFHLTDGLRGLLGLWLPGKWKEVNPQVTAPAGDIGGKAHVVLHIDNSEGEAALANLRKHGVKLWGPRYNEKGEIHIDFEDPDGHMLEYWGIAKEE